MSVKEEPEETTTQQSIRMKSGDYRIHIYIEEGRALLPPKGNDTTDPIVSVRIHEQQKSTKPLDDVGSSSTIYWGEHLFFELNDMTHEILEDQKITISANDHTFLFKDSLIGLHELDLLYIYAQKNHAIIHTWIILSNPTDENFDVMRGYLKIGVSVLHEDDSPVDLAIKESVSEKDKDLMMPPHVKPKVIQLVVQILKAEHLPVLDKGETLDAYCVLKFAGASVKSSTFTADKATLSAYWYEELYVPVMQPNVTKTITLSLWDHDTVSADDLVGSVNMNFQDVKKGLLQDYFWANIYGAPELIENDAAEYMNNVPEAASNWRGRVLLRAWITDGGDSVFKKCQEIEDPDIKIHIRDSFETGPEYELRAQVFSATALPEKSEDYAVVISWSGIVLTTKPQKSKNGNVHWYENCKRHIEMIPPGCESMLPDVIVYLVMDDKKVCFARLNANEFRDLHSEPRWVSLLPDLAVGKVKGDWNAGFIRLRIYLGEFDDDNDISDGGWGKMPPLPPMERFVLLSHIFQCQDLPASDKNGLADPYITIYCAGNEVSTKDKPKECTLNPKWYKTLPLEIEVPSINEAPQILIFIYDYDAISSDDIIGVCSVDIEEADRSLEAAPRPKWYDVQLDKTCTQGKILASFTLAPQSSVPRFDIMPAFHDKTIDINILGLRDLKPAVGWLPVNKAFVRIDLNSLELPDCSQGIRFMQTQPFEKGNNPNINSTLSFRCKIPNDPLYAPTLTCTVLDYLFAGLSQPVIGTFTIHLSKYIYNETEKISKVGDLISNLGSSQASIPSNLDASGQYQIEEKKAPPMSIIKEKGESTYEETKHEETKHEEEKKEVSIFKPSVKEQAAAIQNIDLEDTLKTEESALVEIQPRQIEARGERVTSLEDALAGRTVLYAQFGKQNKKIKEVNKPNPEYYIELGYTREPEDTMKHYRYYLSNEMEKTPILQPRIFDEFQLTKGQSRGLDDVPFAKASKDKTGAMSTVEVTGLLKGKIRVTDYPPKKRLIDVFKTNQAHEDEFDYIGKLLLNSQQVVVRVYVIDAFDLVAKDSFSHSDPYIRIKIGKRVVSDKDNWQEDCPNPKIYKCFEISTTLPGQSILKIQMFDYNKVFSDSKIGTTKIDLEDRFFSNKWKSLRDIPVETRPLFVPHSRVPQGYVRLWVEIHRDSSVPDILDISPKPPAEFEARLIIWRSEDIENADFEGVSDLYVRAWVNPEEQKETDTHYRCQRGKGSWNWRLKFPYIVPSETNLLTVQIWDKDIFSGNDFIGEATIPFNDLAATAWEENIREKMMGKAENLSDRLMRKEAEKFWVDLKKRHEETGVLKDKGKILISFELVPKSRAEACPVGEGRSEPNIDPFLPAPVGRFKWSWNPLSMISQLCGPEFKFKICCAICCALCCLLIIFMLPMILSDGLANAVFNH